MQNKRERSRAGPITMQSESERNGFKNSMQDAECKVKNAKWGGIKIERLF
jgi:hypothetical protein